jgi:hypothetical protein
MKLCTKNYCDMVAFLRGLERFEPSAFAEVPDFFKKGLECSQHFSRIASERTQDNIAERLAEIALKGLICDVYPSEKFAELLAILVRSQSPPKPPHTNKHLCVQLVHNIYPSIERIGDSVCLHLMNCLLHCDQMFLHTQKRGGRDKKRQMPDNSACRLPGSSWWFGQFPATLGTDPQELTVLMSMSMTSQIRYQASIDGRCAVITNSFVCMSAISSVESGGRPEGWEQHLFLFIVVFGESGHSLLECTRRIANLHQMCERRSAMQRHNATNQTYSSNTLVYISVYESEPNLYKFIRLQAQSWCGTTHNYEE